MRFSTIISTAAFLASIGTLVQADGSASKYRVNGWYPCSYTNEGNSGLGSSFDDMTVFECAHIQVPLCYDEVCKSDQKIEVFVKRYLAKPKDNSQSNTKRKAMIFVQGGPGATSVFMESSMISLLDNLGDDVDYYTFDHRGTGRSEFLDCDTAQAQTGGSPDGAEIGYDELPTCLQDLNKKYDGQAAAFSVTSAAKDVEAIIQTFLADQDVHIMSYSYGTYLLQRILQLQIPQIKGYIFDSVDVRTNKGDPLESANSHWNQAILTASRRLLQACFDDETCPLKLQSRDKVIEEVLSLYADLDANVATNECAQLLQAVAPEAKPSDVLRDFLSTKVSQVGSRVVAIQALSWVQNCNADNAAKLEDLIASEQNGEATRGPGADPLGDSSILYNVIVNSERWSQPSPTAEEITKMITDGPFSVTLPMFPLFCIYTGGQDPACKTDELKDIFRDITNATFTYSHDKYFELPLTVPDHAGVLIFGGGLDFATPLEFSELLYKKLEGGAGRKMVTFNNGVHCGGEAAEENTTTSCYESIIGSFVLNNADVTKVDTDCIANVPSIVWN